MSLAGFLRSVVRILEDAEVPFMLTGSLAAAYYAAPRATRDVDLVIEAGPEVLDRIVQGFRGEGYYVSAETARGALARRGQFNVIDPNTGWKADLILRKDRGFSRSEFGRRQRAEILGIEVPLVTPEDLILAKLEWAALGRSERQLADVAELLKSHRGTLDGAYVARWAEVLDVEEGWRDAQGRLDEEAAGSSDP